MILQVEYRVIPHLVFEPSSTDVYNIKPQNGSTRYMLTLTLRIHHTTQDDPSNNNKSIIRKLQILYGHLINFPQHYSFKISKDDQFTTWWGTPRTKPCSNKTYRKSNNRTYKPIITLWLSIYQRCLTLHLLINLVLVLHQKSKSHKLNLSFPFEYGMLEKHNL